MHCTRVSIVSEFMFYTIKSLIKPQVADEGFPITWVFNCGIHINPLMKQQLRTNSGTPFSSLPLYSSLLSPSVPQTVSPYLKGGRV
jgi:hypothetical protein